MTFEILDMWKALNKGNYPLTIKRQENNDNGINMPAWLVAQSR